MPQVELAAAEAPGGLVPFQGEFAFVGAPAEPKKDKDEDEGRTETRPDDDGASADND